MATATAWIMSVSSLLPFALILNYPNNGMTSKIKIHTCLEIKQKHCEDRHKYLSLERITSIYTLVN